ncbi:MAG: ABC transporter permease [Acidimicrobiia bacterium]|nr:ABC transporter permease [Acidimicrobiia bacterium]
MTTTTAAEPTVASLAEFRSTSRAAFESFGAMLLRDMRVLRKQIVPFLMRTIMQPLLMVFVFAYVFPKIGQGIGGSPESEALFSTLLAPGLIAISCIFQGIQAVTLPVVMEFGFSREIEDRVLAPMPVWAIGIEKIVSGAIQSAISAVLVLPFVLWIPSTPVHLDIDWPVVVTFTPLICLLSGAIGLFIGTRAEPRQVPLVFSIIVLPMTMLGAAYYPWARLSSIAWLKWAVLANPLVFMSEGMRAGMTAIPHMGLWAVYGAVLGFGTVFAWLGIRGFRMRVLA